MIIQKAKKDEAYVEDILFTMFEEPENYAQGLQYPSNHSSLDFAEPDSDADTNEELLSYLGDYYSPAAGAKPSQLAPAAE